MKSFFDTPPISQDFLKQLRTQVMDVYEQQQKPRWQWWWVPVSAGIVAMLALWWTGGQEVQSMQQQLTMIDAELSALESELTQDQDIINAIEFNQL